MFGMNVSAFITNMDCPIGRTVGNALEVADAIDCLNSKGPKDLLELTITLGADNHLNSNVCLFVYVCFSAVKINLSTVSLPEVQKIETGPKPFVEYI